MNNPDVLAALQAVEAGNAGDWSTVAAVLADEVQRLSPAVPLVHDTSGDRPEPHVVVMEEAKRLRAAHDADLMINAHLQWVMSKVRLRKQYRAAIKMSREGSDQELNLCMASDILGAEIAAQFQRIREHIEEHTDVPELTDEDVKEFHASALRKVKAKYG